MMRVVLCQFETGSPVSEEERSRLAGQRPDFVTLPEYFFAPPDGGTHAGLAQRFDECLDFLARLSDETGAVVVGGTTVERRGGRLFNVCPILDRGRLIARYDKRHPTAGELRAGITPGDEAVVVEVRGVRVAALICADVLQPERFEEAGRLRAQILFTPVVAPFRPDDTPETKESRDRGLFLEGARRANAFVVKTAAPGRIFGKPLQARSLVAAPWGFVLRVRPDQERERLMLCAQLDLDLLGAPPGPAPGPDPEPH